MTKARMREIISNTLAWGVDHDREFMECLIDAMDLTDKEIKELDLEEYIEEEDEEDE